MSSTAPMDESGNKSALLILGGWICLAGGAGVAGWLESANAPVVAGVVWNTIGLTDILFVVMLALRLGLQDRQSMHALREFPLSLLPTFLVPLIIVSHVLIFIRAARMKSKPS